MSQQRALKRKIKAETQTRSFSLELRWAGDNDHVLEGVSFSSETPVRRYWGNEILDHSPGAANLSRFLDGAAVRDEHDGDQIGVVIAAEIGADRKGRATVRFSRNQRAEEVRRDIADGIRRNVSVAYKLQKMRLESTDAEGVDTYRAEAWEPVHLAFVADPADASVGVGRADGQEHGDVEIVGDAGTEPAAEPADEKETRKMSTENQKPEPVPAAPAAPAAPAIDVKGAVRDAMEILSIGERHGMRDEAKRHVEAGGSLDEFRALALRKLAEGLKPVDPLPPLKVPEKDAKRYSLCRALNLLAQQKPLDGLEREMSVEMAKRTGKQPEGFFVPMNLGNRALAAGTDNVGGYSVGTDVLAGSLIELLRNKQVCVAAGARVLSGLQGDVAIPTQSGGATAYWTAEVAETTDSTQGMGQVALTPHKLGATSMFSKQLLAQSSLDVEAFVREDIATVLAIAKDLAALAGSGAGGQPSGIITQCTAGAVTFGGAATWADMCLFESTLAASNADVGSIAFVVSPSVRGKWKQIEQATNTAAFLWSPDNTVNGYRALVTNQSLSHKVIFGNFADLILADWEGLDVVVDPYTRAAFHQVRVVMHMLTDVGIRHTASFVCSTDSGAQ